MVNIPSHNYQIMARMYGGCTGENELQYTIRTQVCKTIMDYSQEDFQKPKNTNTA